MFEGVITALVTPFKNHQVDFSSLEKVLSQQLMTGVEGFVVSGTTGESPNLRPSEIIEIFKRVQAVVSGQVPILLGTGSNSTEKTIELTQKAESLGADGALVVCPYYNKPPQRGLFSHFLKVAESVELPIVLYNVPSRTVISLEAETVGNLGLARAIAERSEPEFTLISGDDDSCIDFIFQGGSGVISVASHVIPKEMVRLTKMAREKDRTALAEYQRYRNLIRGLGIETNPSPIKMALFFMGLLETPELRLPLVSMDEKNQEQIKFCLDELGLLS